ncbi:MAG: O-antigen ligase family protein [Candidatus Woesebacteria bacterium]|nr:O-antigen ligase family protein [Candidatus Woesebacteria bacterium]
MQKLLQVFKPSFFKFLTTALLITIPLYPKFPAIRIPGIYVAVRLEDFLILFTLLIFLIPMLINFKSFIKEKVPRAIILFLLIGFISTLSGILITQTVIPSIALLHFFRRVEYLSLFFVGFIFIKQIKDNSFFEYLLKILLIINLFVFLYGFGQKYFNLPIIITQNEEYSKGVALRYTAGSHINSSFAGHYDLASYLVLIMPIFISAFYIFKDKISKIILGISTFLGFWLLSAAVSRIAIVAFLISTTVSLFLLKKYKALVTILVISVIIFGFSSDLRVRYSRIMEIVRQKITSVVTVYAQEDGNVNEDRSTSIRFNVEWPRAIRAFTKNPLLGTGYSSITLATDNDYLRALGETGILGLFSFILIFISLFKVFSMYRFESNLESVFIASFIGSTIGILITALFIDIFEASKFATIYWLFTGFVVGKITQNDKLI